MLRASSARIAGELALAPFIITILCRDTLLLSAGVNWMYFMLLFLFIFNEPLLWMKYYAVEDAGEW